MRFKRPAITGTDIIAYALTALQVLVLIGIATIFVSAFGLVGMSAAASMVIMFLLGLPLLILLYTSTTDKALKAAFFGLMANIVFLSIAGIIWFIVSDILKIEWLVTAGKVLMAIGYVPLVYALYTVYRDERERLDRGIRTFIVSANVCFAAGIVLIMLIGLPSGDLPDIAIYGFTTLEDIVVLTMAGMLIVARPSMRSRYIFSIIFLFILWSFFGDLLNFIHALRLGPPNIAGYSGYFYDFMMIFLVTALLVYTFMKDDGAAAVDEAKRKLGDTLHAMHDLLSQLPDAACVFSPEGYALAANEPFLRIFAVREKDILGKYNLFSHASTLKYDLKEKLELLKDGKTVCVDRIKIFLHGREAYLSFKTFPTFAMDGTISGYIAICEDVTSRVREEEELRQAKSMAELYIDLMGHDINNMNQVGMGYLEIAMNTLPVTVEQKSLLIKPLEAMTNSSRLIDNVKKLRRASTGDMYQQDMDLGKVLAEVIAEHGQAPGRDVAIMNGVDHGVIVRANELLKDVFSNLVGNAIKHSEGPVRIGIRCEPFETGSRKYYRVSVEDNGPGIPDDIKPLIFDRLLRGRNRTRGSGLGLYLVKTLIDNYGGSISVEDRVPGDGKQGTRFIIMLPAA